MSGCASRPTCGAPGSACCASPTAKAATACGWRAAACRWMPSTSPTSAWPRHGAWPRTKGANVNFQVADCDGFAWPQAAYDGVAAIFIQFADPALRERLFAHIQRCLKPGGTLVLQGYTPKQLEYRTGGPPAGFAPVHRGAAARGLCRDGHRGTARVRGRRGRRQWPPGPLGADRDGGAAALRHRVDFMRRVSRCLDYARRPVATRLRAIVGTALSARNARLRFPANTHHMDRNSG